MKVFLHIGENNAKVEHKLKEYLRKISQSSCLR